ncbi:SCO4225 family membrane protein [Streptomyces sp. MMBL 11-3]|uniref:SCO4225 family membrane protein n=1 Tax=Streptomyces sp. MMBL 11-3 TaxID=3382639 RepID=UPI0039B62980
MPHTSGPRRPADRPAGRFADRLRPGLLALATDNWLARGYLAVVACSVAVMFLFPDSGFAAGPLVLTAPLSFLSVVLPFGPGTEGGAAQVLAVGFWSVWLLGCAFVNAAVLGALTVRSTGSVRPASPVRPKSAAPHGLRRVRTLLAPAVDNWLGRGYLAVVAATLGFFLYAVYVSPDPGFAGIWPLMATAPLSMLTLLVPISAESAVPDWLDPLLFSAGVALSGLFNAVLFGHLAHGLRTRRTAVPS